MKETIGPFDKKVQLNFKKFYFKKSQTFIIIIENAH